MIQLDPAQDYVFFLLAERRRVRSGMLINSNKKGRLTDREVRVAMTALFNEGLIAKRKEHSNHITWFLTAKGELAHEDMMFSAMEKERTNNGTDLDGIEAALEFAAAAMDAGPNCFSRTTGVR